MPLSFMISCADKTPTPPDADCIICASFLFLNAKTFNGTTEEFFGNCVGQCFTHKAHSIHLSSST